MGRRLMGKRRMLNRERETNALLASSTPPVSTKVANDARVTCEIKHIETHIANTKVNNDI